jgi:hypothetical protein
MQCNPQLYGRGERKKPGETSISLWENIIKARLTEHQRVHCEKRNFYGSLRFQEFLPWLPAAHLRTIPFLVLGKFGPHPVAHTAQNADSKFVLFIHVPHLHIGNSWK